MGLGHADVGPRLVRLGLALVAERLGRLEPGLDLGQPRLGRLVPELGLLDVLPGEYAALLRQALGLAPRPLLLGAARSRADAASFTFATPLR